MNGIKWIGGVRDHGGSFVNPAGASGIGHSQDMKANWGSNERIISSFVDLREIADDVRRSGQPTMVFLEAEDGGGLCSGSGRKSQC